MSVSVEALPGLEYWSGAVTGILGRCDGGGGHLPHRADVRGLRLTRVEMEELAFPRAQVAPILREYNLSLDAPAAALANCDRLAEPNALVVATGQQPMPAGGPLLIFYKALTCIALARQAEELLGQPVVPIFWNASEDHDLDEMRHAVSPGPRGETCPLALDLSPWKGRAAAAVEADPRWQEPIGEWLGQIPAPVGGERFAPRPDEGWSRYFSRVLSSCLGPQGLILVEPSCLRAPAASMASALVEGWPEAATLLQESWQERYGKEYIRSFPPLEGPPLFLEHQGRRRRLLGREGGFVLRGLDLTMERDDLAGIIAAEPERISWHGALRPLVQNSLLPVVAMVVGPGEITYLEELYRFHASPLGAGRRMPLLVPRLSATILDERCTVTMNRFGLASADPFLAEEEILTRFVPDGALAVEVKELEAELGRRLADLGQRALRLEPTLEKQFTRTGANLAQLFGRLAEKLGAVEAGAKGYGPDRLRRLARYVRPGGRLQERVFSLGAFPRLVEPEIVGDLLERIDPWTPVHCLLRLRT